MKYPIVEVEWLDSSTLHGWNEYDPSDLRCHSVGFLIKDAPDRLVLTDSLALLSPDSKYKARAFHCPQEIPKVAVLKVRYLRK